jgi:hypothetical protein
MKKVLLQKDLLPIIESLTVRGNKEANEKQ